METFLDMEPGRLFKIVYFAKKLTKKETPTLIISLIVSIPLHERAQELRNTDFRLIEFFSPAVIARIRIKLKL